MSSGASLHRQLFLRGLKFYKRALIIPPDFKYLIHLLSPFSYLSFFNHVDYQARSHKAQPQPHTRAILRIVVQRSQFPPTPVFPSFRRDILCSSKLLPFHPAPKLSNHLIHPQIHAPLSTTSPEININECIYPPPPPPHLPRSLSQAKTHNYCTRVRRRRNAHRRRA